MAMLAAGAAVLAMAGAATVLAYQRDIAAARSRIEGRSMVLDSPYGPIEYAEAGSGQPLLIIHGSGGGFDQGLAFAAPLLARGYRVIAPSRFGYLRSAFPDGGGPEMQADALAFLVRRLGIGPVVIYGGSAGALSATQMALRHPELCRGLVLMVPASYAPDRRPNASAAPAPEIIRALVGSNWLFWLGIRIAPGLMTKLVLATDPNLLRTASEADRLRVRAVLENILPISARRRGLELDMTTAGTPPRYRLEDLKCPVLAISARDDLYGTAASAAFAARTAPVGRLVLYPTGGHLLVGRSEEAAGQTDAFVKSLEAAP
jgi:2-hydroxy-6-oxonona-2,4-dienedioate hydrolase